MMDDSQVTTGDAARGPARLWVLLALFGCGPSAAALQGGGDDGGATTVGPLPSTTGGTDPAQSTTVATSTTAPGDSGRDTFVADDSADSELDEGGFGFDCLPAPPGTQLHCLASPFCDVYAQDCGVDEKCVPRAVGGGVIYDLAVCVPVVAGPAQLGEPCSFRGPLFEARDNCDFGAVCYFVDPGTSEGICTPLCEGSAQAPSCVNPATACFGPVGVCTPSCDPLVADECAQGSACVCPNPSNASCACAAQPAVTATSGEPCQFHGECEEATACIATPSCATETCCTVYCDLADPDPPCPEAASGQTCVALFEPGAGIFGSDVGVCFP